jgi:epoxyqueuosine reductase
LCDPERVTSADVKQQARALGFDLCGIASAAPHPELPFFREWLDRGYAGEMAYLHRSADRRADARAVLPSARTVVSLGTIYNVDRPYSTTLADPRQAALSRYAWGDDYHAVLQGRLDRLLQWMQLQVGDAFEGRAYVDTGPIQERVYAQHAGLGWIGKNTCLIHPQLGSWIFLSEIICNLDLEPDAPVFDHCGTCTRCIDACPTDALVAPRVLDSTRCLSYLTIELKTSIPDEHRGAIGEHAYGCDICQEVCPWNLRPSTAQSQDAAWQPRRGLDGPSLLALWRRSDDELRALMKGSAMKRAGVRRFRRNLAVAIGNSGDPEAIAALTAERTQADETCADPLVVEHVEWALEKLRGVEGTSR